VRYRPNFLNENAAKFVTYTYDRVFSLNFQYFDINSVESFRMAKDRMLPQCNWLHYDYILIVISMYFVMIII
jgi:hypothetical protein